MAGFLGVSVVGTGVTMESWTSCGSSSAGLEEASVSGAEPLGHTWSSTPSMAATEDLLSTAPLVYGAKRPTMSDTPQASSGSAAMMPTTQRVRRKGAGRKSRIWMNAQTVSTMTQYGAAVAIIFLAVAISGRERRSTRGVS